MILQMDRLEAAYIVALRTGLKQPLWDCWFSSWDSNQERLMKLIGVREQPTSPMYKANEGVLQGNRCWMRQERHQWEHTPITLLNRRKYFKYGGAGHYVPEHPRDKKWDDPVCREAKGERMTSTLIVPSLLNPNVKRGRRLATINFFHTNSKMLQKIMQQDHW